ncbi:MAG: AMP-binding protein [Acidiferrobacterales bacterium]|nr:AMP-binding protein [Acidiferrobacterales bacterium]
MQQERFWQSSYEPGVPGEIDPAKVVPLVDYLTHTAENYPEAIAFSSFGHQINYRDFERQSKIFAAGLVTRFGLSPGDRVAIMLPNVIQFPIALYGILRAGMVAVNVNPLYTPRELRHQLVDSQSKAIIVLENFAHVLEQVLDDTQVENIVVSRVGDCLPTAKGFVINSVLKYVKKMVPSWRIPQAVPYRRFIEEHQNTPQTDHSINIDELAFLQYTGGTTGVSKGVELTHRNVSANVQQGLGWCLDRFQPGEDVAITALPLYHIFALTANLLFMVAVAGNCVLITNPRDFKGFVKELKNWQMTYITGVNTLYAALLNTDGFDQVDFSKLKLTLGAGMAVTSPVARDWIALTGRPLVEVYGLSETSPAVCMNRLDLEEYNGFIGLPIASTDLIIADDDGNPVPLGEQGELCVRGPQVTKGYWQRPEETANSFTADGFFRTGDFATINEQGYVKILDRKKDMILVSGFNVYPNEIEDVVSDHPGVLEVAAVGIDDEKSGERVKLYVCKKDDTLTEEALISWCRENMTSYKVPKEVEFRAELPKSTVGKILRRELRDTG